MTSIILDDGGHTRECDRVVTISRASLTTWNDPRIEPLLNRSVVRRGKPSPSPGCAGGPTRTRSRIPSRSWRGPTLSRGSGTGSGLRPWLPRGSPQIGGFTISGAHVRCTPHRPRGAPKGLQIHLGHSTIQVTMDRYGDLFPDEMDRLAEGLDTVLSSGNGQRGTRSTQIHGRSPAQSAAERGRRGRLIAASRCQRLGDLPDWAQLSSRARKSGRRMTARSSQVSYRRLEAPDASYTCTMRRDARPPGFRALL